MVTIGVIGCGHWGPNLIRNFHHINGVNVMFACDLDESRLQHIQKLYPEVGLSRDYREVINSRDLDAVCIATPAATHYQIAKDALTKGKHVFMEKPITLDSKDAAELIGIAKNQGKILMVGHTYEYNPSVLKLNDLVRSEELGNILYVGMTRVNLGIFREDVNVIWDLCPHDISILRTLFDAQPVSVEATGGAHRTKGIEDVAFVTLHYPGDMLVQIHVSWLEPRKVRRVVVVGDKKMAVFDDLDDRNPIQIYDTPMVKQPYYDTFGDFKSLYNWGDVYAPKIDMTEPLRAECSHFVDSIKDKKAPRSDGNSGLQVIRILEATQESLKNDGRTVTI